MTTQHDTDVREATPTVRIRFLAPEVRKRGIRGLSEPNLYRTYTHSEIAERWSHICGLRTAMAAATEPTQSLWGFLGPAARAAIAENRTSSDGRAFWNHYKVDVTEASDEFIASIPGLRARHIYEARLARWQANAVKASE